MSEQTGDSRRVIDIQLRARCNRLVNASADLVLGQLAVFVDKAEDEVT